MMSAGAQSAILWVFFIAAIVIVAGYWVFITASVLLHYFGPGKKGIAEERAHYLDEVEQIKKG